MHRSREAVVACLLAGGSLLLGAVACDCEEATAPPLAGRVAGRPRGP